MDINELAEELKYFSSDSVYVITWNNALKQVFTPFRIAVISNVGQLSIGEVVWVQKVKVTYQLKTVFIVEGKAYYHFHFGFVID